MIVRNNAGRLTKDCTGKDGARGHVSTRRVAFDQWSDLLTQHSDLALPFPTEARLGYLRMELVAVNVSTNTAMVGVDHQRDLSALQCTWLIVLLNKTRTGLTVTTECVRSLVNNLVEARMLRDELCVVDKRFERVVVLVRGIVPRLTALRTRLIIAELEVRFRVEETCVRLRLSDIGVEQRTWNPTTVNIAGTTAQRAVANISTIEPYEFLHFKRTYVMMTIVACPSLLRGVEVGPIGDFRVVRQPLVFELRGGIQFGVRHWIYQVKEPKRINHLFHGQAQLNQLKTVQLARPVTLPELLASTKHMRVVVDVVRSIIDEFVLILVDELTCAVIKLL